MAGKRPRGTANSCRHCAGVGSCVQPARPASSLHLILAPRRLDRRQSQRRAATSAVRATQAAGRAPAAPWQPGDACIRASRLPELCVSFPGDVEPPICRKPLCSVHDMCAGTRVHGGRLGPGSPLSACPRTRLATMAEVRPPEARGQPCVMRAMRRRRLGPRRCAHDPVSLLCCVPPCCSPCRPSGGRCGPLAGRLAPCWPASLARRLGRGRASAGSTARGAPRRWECRRRRRELCTANDQGAHVLPLLLPASPLLLQKNSVAVAHVKRGKGEIRLNGEAHNALRRLRQGSAPFAETALECTHKWQCACCDWRGCSWGSCNEAASSSRDAQHTVVW